MTTEERFFRFQQSPGQWGRLGRHVFLIKILRNCPQILTHNSGLCKIYKSDGFLVDVSNDLYVHLVAFTLTLMLRVSRRK